MGLTAQQWRFIAARLTSSSDKEAAEQVGVRPQQVYEWKYESPEFRQAYEAAFADGVHVAMEMCRQALGEAAATLREGLTAMDARGRPDWSARMAAVKLLFQSHGLLREKREITGADGGAIQVRQALDLAALTDEELETIATIYARKLRPPRPSGDTSHNDT